jgi:hypothetical protein
VAAAVLPPRHSHPLLLLHWAALARLLPIAVLLVALE